MIEEDFISQLLRRDEQRVRSNEKSNRARASFQSVEPSPQKPRQRWDRWPRAFLSWLRVEEVDDEDEQGVGDGENEEGGPSDGGRHRRQDLDDEEPVEHGRDGVGLDFRRGLLEVVLKLCASEAGRV